MRGFFRTSSGEANEAASRVAHAVASNASSSVEQPVEAFVSIEAVNRWLNSRGELPSSSDCERLRAAVVVLTSKPKPRKEDVRPLCFSWNVRVMEHKKSRPLATLITELQQAVLVEVFCPSMQRHTPENLSRDQSCNRLFLLKWFVHRCSDTPQRISPEIHVSDIFFKITPETHLSDTLHKNISETRTTEILQRHIFDLLAFCL